MDSKEIMKIYFNKKVVISNAHNIEQHDITKHVEMDKSTTVRFVPLS